MIRHTLKYCTCSSIVFIKSYLFIVYFSTVGHSIADIFGTMLSLGGFLFVRFPTPINTRLGHAMFPSTSCNLRNSRILLQLLNSHVDSKKLFFVLCLDACILFFHVLKRSFLCMKSLRFVALTLCLSFQARKARVLLLLLLPENTSSKANVSERHGLTLATHSFRTWIVRASVAAVMTRVLLPHHAGSRGRNLHGPPYLWEIPGTTFYAWEETGRRMIIAIYSLFLYRLVGYKEEQWSPATTCTATIPIPLCCSMCRKIALFLWSRVVMEIHTSSSLSRRRFVNSRDQASIPLTAYEGDVANFSCKHVLCFFLKELTAHFTLGQGSSPQWKIMTLLATPISVWM